MNLPLCVVTWHAATMCMFFEIVLNNARRDTAANSLNDTVQLPGSATQIVVFSETILEDSLDKFI